MAVEARRVVIGRIGGPYGVRGWVKVYSYTEPREEILTHRQWWVHMAGEWRPLALVEGRPHGKTIVARLADYDDRDAVQALTGCEIGVPRSTLAALAPDEFYWSDLQGLRVLTQDGVELGVVDHLLETGANDVLVVKGERERLIPYVRGQVVTDVDLGQGVMRVEWDPEF